MVVYLLRLFPKFCVHDLRGVSLSFILSLFWGQAEFVWSVDIIHSSNVGLVVFSRETTSVNVCGHSVAVPRAPAQ